MFYNNAQSFLNFLRILNRLEVGVFARTVKLESPCTFCIFVLYGKQHDLLPNLFKPNRCAR
jgi:hypothetical protein